MTGNPNHPKPGSEIKVEPIRSMKDIAAIKKQLAGNPRNLALFTVGINTALRAGDLLKITAGQVRRLKAGDVIEIKEQKTGKRRAITVNKPTAAAIADLLSACPVDDREPLFQSQRGGKAISVGSLNRLVKTWCAALRIPGNYGSHTLRKTFGYHQRVTFGVALPILTEIYNHATQRQTLDYLCIQDEEIADIYMQHTL